MADHRAPRQPRRKRPATPYVPRHTPEAIAERLSQLITRTHSELYHLGQLDPQEGTPCPPPDPESSTHSTAY